MSLQHHLRNTLNLHCCLTTTLDTIQLFTSHNMNTTFAPSGHSSFVESHDVALVIGTVSVSSIVSLPLNICVLWLIFAGAQDTLTSDFFSLCLTVSEIFLSFSTVWYFVSVWLNSFFCFEAFMFSRGLFYTARPLFQCYICAECYLGVVHPVLFLRFKPLRYRVAVCSVAWLIVLFSCIYSLYTYSEPVYFYAFFIQNLLCFFFMLFCCLSVVWALKRPGPGEKSTDKKKSHATKRKAVKVILFITIYMAINFFLYVVVIPMQCCLKETEFVNGLTISSVLAFTTGFSQPLLYLHRNGKLCFRKL